MQNIAIVTKTITAAASNLLPILGVFLVVCVAYAALGTSIYGHQIEAWSSFGESLGSVFLIIIGDFDYYDDSKCGANRMIVF
jgi:hypothetical protein